MCELAGPVLFCILALSFIMLAVWVVLEGLKLILLWIPRTKDLQELGRRLDRWAAETRKRQTALGGPATLRGALWVLPWRVWKAYTHPIRTWRGELMYPPKKGATDSGGPKP
jgi:hypothetical protein